MSAKTTESSLFEALKNRIEARTATIGVIGMGYVGLPLALLFSEQKFPVTGFDIDQKKVEVLEAGGSYIYRITPPEIQARSGPGLSRHRGLLQHFRDGRNRHLRSHAAERVSRA